MQQYKALLDALEPAPGIPNPSLSASMSTIELKRPQGASRQTHLPESAIAPSRMSYV